jgi:hypothetical protein
MQTAPKLQAIVTQLAQKHGVDLSQAGAYLRLDLAGHGQLVVENIGADRVSVANYVEIAGIWVVDPEIVVDVDRRLRKEGSQLVRLAWIPIEITEVFGGWRLCAELDEYGGLVLYDLADQIELTNYVEHTVAVNLMAHGWLEQGKRSTEPVHLWTPEEVRRRAIHVDEPWPVTNEETHP